MLLKGSCRVESNQLPALSKECKQEIQEDLNYSEYRDTLTYCFCIYVT